MDFGGISVPIWLVTLVSSYLLIGVFMSVVNFLAIKEKYIFIFKYFLQFGIYIFELTCIYYAYKHLSTSHPFGNPEYESKDIPLQQFAVFFSAYQIFIFIVLKLYDSLHKDAYCSVISVIEKIQAYVDEDRLVPEDMLSEEHINKIADNLPRKAHEYYTELLEQVKIYNTNLKLQENIQETENHSTKLKKYKGLVSDAKIKILHLKANASISKEETDFHWNNSLFLRLFKWVFNRPKKAPDNQ